MPDALVNFALRGTQIIFAAIVTGLSIDLARGHHWGGLPVILGYVCFVGCVSLLAGFAGLAASWITILQGKIGLLMDGFITIVNLAGGLLVAIKLGGVKCDINGSTSTESAQKVVNNYLINGGTRGKKEYGYENSYYFTFGDAGIKMIVGRCKKNQADSAFMFLTVIVLLASITMTYLRMKKGY